MRLFIAFVIAAVALGYVAHHTSNLDCGESSDGRCASGDHHVAA